MEIWSRQLHRGTIVQTRTPINPGNSGGPLLADDGKIVGVNLFVTKGAEGLNFAVGAKEIRSYGRANEQHKKNDS